MLCNFDRVASAGTSGQGGKHRLPFDHLVQRVRNQWGAGEIMEPVSVETQFGLECIAGQDGSIHGPLVFADVGGVENFRADTFHNEAESLVVVYDIPLDQG